VSALSLSISSDTFLNFFSGIVTGGGDKQIKFWEFELNVPTSAQQQSDDTNATPATAVKKRQLSLVHTRTLQLTDDILCVKHSPDGRYIAAGMLDSTVKVFYEDSLKFFLSLYGHKLPVLYVS
jgi:U3 small nucleolar RNA-associated protein 12